jgi:integrase/recombinase XerD
VGSPTEQPERQEPPIAIPKGKVAIIVDAALVQRLGLALAEEQGVTEAEADALFERSLYRKELSEKTRARYRSCWHEFKLFMIGTADGRSPVLATDDDLQAFVNYLQSTSRVMPDSAGVLRPHPLQASSVRAILACLSSFFAQCQKKRYRFDNPTEDIRRPRRKSKRGLVLSDQEVARLLAVSGPPRCRVQAYLLHYTAARTESLRFLRWRDIDFVEDLIHFDTAKGDRAYTIPLHPQLKASLIRWQDELETLAEANPRIRAALSDPETAFVLLTREGKPLSHTTIAKQYKWRAKRAGIKPHAPSARVGRENTSRVSPHAARRTVGTELRRRGVDIADVADLLNHKDLQTTREFYAFTSTPQQRQVVERLQYSRSRHSASRESVHRSRRSA